LKYKIIYLFFFSLINYNIVYAFFMINDHSEEIRIEHTTIDRSAQGNNVFQLYDNFFYNDINNFLIKRVDGFISADQIEINIPLKILARDAIYPENSIDRMLLANLRIKKLISEYMELQKKARLILQNSEMPGMRTLNNKGKGGKSNIESEKKKINKNLLSINRLSGLTQDDISSNKAVFLKKYSNLKNKTSPLSENAATRIIDDNPDLVNADTAMGKQILTGKENSELPWIFSLFLKILNYIFNNRLEIILYMIFIAVVGYFISLQVRR